MLTQVRFVRLLFVLALLATLVSLLKPGEQVVVCGLIANTLIAVNSDKPSAPPPPTQSTVANDALASNRLTPAEIAALRQGKKFISDYVAKELPARLARLNLAGDPQKATHEQHHHP